MPPRSGRVVELADDDRAPQRGQAGDDLRQAGEAVEGLAAEAVAVGGDEHDGLGLAEAVDHAGDAEIRRRRGERGPDGCWRRASRSRSRARCGIHAATRSPGCTPSARRRRRVRRPRREAPPRSAPGAPRPRRRTRSRRCPRRARGASRFSARLTLDPGKKRAPSIEPSPGRTATSPGSPTTAHSRPDRRPELVEVVHRPAVQVGASRRPARPTGGGERRHPRGGDPFGRRGPQRRVRWRRGVGGPRPSQCSPARRDAAPTWATRLGTVMSDHRLHEQRSVDETLDVEAGVEPEVVEQGHGLLRRHVPRRAGGERRPAESTDRRVEAANAELETGIEVDEPGVDGSRGGATRRRCR